jgi:hypothetical protein
MPAGRPTKYKEQFAEQAKKLCKLGCTDKELADFFEVSEQTLNAWKKEFPEFLESLKEGKTLADANVAQRLYERAMGYEHPETKFFTVSKGDFIQEIETRETIKFYPPDTTAAIFWLKNRQPDKWREKQEVMQTNFEGIRVISGDDPPEGE